MSRSRTVLLALAVFICTAAQSSFAIPAFARMYGTSCSTCHIDFPKLNDFGKAFKDAGFRFPKDDDWLKFTLSNVFKLPNDALSLRVGQFELDLPWSQARTWNLSGWDIFDQPNVGTGADFVNNSFAIASGTQGVELSGGHSYGGYHYSLAVVNQNTSGTAPGPANVRSGGRGF